ncbi:glycosyltransferase like 2 family protein [Francisella philomiragia]|uniref:glycosyltransferase family 2 protein n=1 Tax=Francisella philomiragia TaxID=28110 RepID=UPI0005A57342|nr:glycosyltransferase family 2 protein [Francisella philomiragia]AJI56271.1 glycosyltransferase like 2 family protein [Francisella philomiragia]
MQKLLTIVTVAYNAEKLIEKTIKSIISQKKFDLVEYIVIDGQSSDGTMEVVKKYRDKIDIIISEQDNGIYDALNKGIELASSPWIIFMHAGDIFFDEKTISSAMNHFNKQWDVIYGSRNMVSEKTGEVIYHEEARPVSDMLITMPFGHQSAFIKLETLKKYPYDTQYRLSADYDSFIRMYKDRCMFHNIKTTICDFAIGGASSLYRLRSQLETISLLIRHFGKDVAYNSEFFINFRYSHGAKRKIKMQNLVNKTEKVITDYYTSKAYKLAYVLIYPISKITRLLKK